LTSDNTRNPVFVGHFSQVLFWAMRDNAEALKKFIPFPDLIHAIAKNMSILGWITLIRGHFNRGRPDKLEVAAIGECSFDGLLSVYLANAY
jgi:hypothetical protein